MEKVVPVSKKKDANLEEKTRGFIKNIITPPETTQNSEEKTNKKDGGKEVEQTQRSAISNQYVSERYGRESVAQLDDDDVFFDNPAVLRAHTRRAKTDFNLSMLASSSIFKVPPTPANHNLSTIFNREVAETTASASFGIFGGESRNAMLRYRVNKSLVKVGLEKARAQSKTCWGNVASTFILRYDSLFLRYLHVALTFIVFQHFFLLKNELQTVAFAKIDAAGAKANVTLTTVQYTAKMMRRWIPPVEFGMMHQLLFQMLLIPLTMSKRLLAVISTDSATRTLFPYSDIVGFHIFLGYWFCWLLFISSALFIFFFAYQCYLFDAGLMAKPNLCVKFQTEIFITGAVCLGVTIIIMVTSYCRNRTPFEVFYIFHMFVFVMFGFAIVHTFDDAARLKGKVRTQTIQWVGSSLLIYATSKFWTKFGSTYKCKVLSKEVLGNVCILTLERPPGFHFEAGQSANLRIPEIDAFAHPFSIASGPKSSKLVFIIEIIERTSWTGKLAFAPVNLAHTEDKIPFVIVSGPFGNPVANLQDTDAVLAIGTGTGVVPMLSLFERRANHLCNISKYALDMNTMQKERIVKKPSNLEFDQDSRKMNNCMSALQLSYREKKLTEQGQESLYFQALVRATSGHIVRFFFDFLSWVLALLEICVMGLTLSWGNLSPGAQKQFGDFFMVALPVCTLVLLVGYGVVLVFRILRPNIYQHSIWLVIDVWIFLAAVITLVYYWMLEQDSFVRPTALQQILRALFALWRAAQLMGNRALNTSMRRANTDSTDVLGTESFKLIWITRNAGIVISYVDILLKLIDRAHVALYGEPAPPGWEYTVGKFIDFEIFVTDVDKDACERLRKHMESDSRGEVYAGKVKFGRPDLEVEVVQHTAKKLIENMSGYHEVLPYSTLVTFCGAPLVSRLIFESVLKSNGLSSILGYPQIHSEFRTQFHGSISGESNQAAPAAPTSESEPEPESESESRPKPGLSTKAPRGTQLIDARSFAALPFATPKPRQDTPTRRKPLPRADLMKSVRSY